jgi:uncharacterized protein (UPF0261 family)
MAVLLIATLDTKSAEAAFLRDRLTAAGVAVTVLDAGVLGPPGFAADVPRERVFEAVGTSLTAVASAADRGRAVEAAARGAARVAEDLHRAAPLDGVLAIGGSAGTTIATAAMRALPFGVPKLMLSTLAAGDTRPYVGVRDVMMLYPVVDFCGLNRMSRVVLANAAAAMAGMVGRPPLPPTGDRPLVGATMFGVTTPCVEAARARLDAVGYEVLVFHATGTGGRTLESLLSDGQLTGSLDVTTTELADELVGGVLTAGPDRLTAAGLRGVPQVISLGALDMVNFGPMATVPEKFRGRKLYAHNPTITLMRTTPEENDALGKEIAQKASAARGPTSVLVPLRGVSALDREGQPFWWPEADAALFQSLRNWTSPGVELVELDLHVNDPAFAEAMASTLLRMMKK